MASNFSWNFGKVCGSQLWRRASCIS